MLDRISQLIKAGTSFAFETTLAGRGHITTIKQAKEAGYSVILVFLYLPSSDMAIERVKSAYSKAAITFWKHY